MEKGGAILEADSESQMALERRQPPRDKETVSRVLRMKMGIGSLKKKTSWLSCEVIMKRCSNMIVCLNYVPRQINEEMNRELER